MARQRDAARPRPVATPPPPSLRPAPSCSSATCVGLRLRSLALVCPLLTSRAPRKREGQDARPRVDHDVARRQGCRTPRLPSRSGTRRLLKLRNSTTKNSKSTSRPRNPSPSSPIPTSRPLLTLLNHLFPTQSPLPTDPASPIHLLINLPPSLPILLCLLSYLPLCPLSLLPLLFLLPLLL